MVECVNVVRLSEQKDLRQTLARDVRDGLTANTKWFPIKYMYDQEGSALYEKIVRDRVYYPYHAECEILRRRAMDIMQFVRPQEVVEVGSGSSRKTRPLIEAMRQTGCYKYVPLDIAESTLLETAKELKEDYPWLQVTGYVGDFDTDLAKLPKNGRRLVVFLGNTVGNFKSKADRVEFLKKLRMIMEGGDALLLGIDLVKDADSMMAGYEDQKGLRRQFYLRPLRIMNSELGANFAEDKFAPVSSWNPTSSSLDFSLVAKEEVRVNIKDLHLEVILSEGEAINIAHSFKFTKEGISEELAEVGLDVVACYTDTNGQFADVMAVPAA